LGDTSDSNFLPGNVLIIQENDIGCGIGGICDQPDDEGSRPTGYLSFVFSQANVVPVPAAFWVFGAALIGFIGFSRRTTV
jgi:hypothetical protein